MTTHVDLCSYATDEAHLYEIWDRDLKKCMSRRRMYEASAVIWVVASLWFLHPPVELFTAVLLAIVYAAITQFIDESNVNYLMHNRQWDAAKRRFEESSLASG